MRARCEQWTRRSPSFSPSAESVPAEGSAEARVVKLLDPPVLAGIYRLSAGNAAGRRIVETPIVVQQAIWQLTTTPSGDLYAGECSLLGGRVVGAEAVGGRAAEIDHVIAGSMSDSRQPIKPNLPQVRILSHDPRPTSVARPTSSSR